MAGCQVISGHMPELLIVMLVAVLIAGLPRLRVVMSGGAGNADVGRLEWMLSAAVIVIGIAVVLAANYCPR